MINVSCSFNCWECPKNCSIKEEMKFLSETEFYRYVIENLKANAGRFMLVNGWNYEEAENFVKMNSVALKIARTKYLETLQ